MYFPIEYGDFPLPMLVYQRVFHEIYPFHALSMGLEYLLTFIPSILAHHVGKYSIHPAYGY